MNDDRVTTDMPSRVEDALRASLERYRMLFDAIDEGFCVIEVLFDDGRPIDYVFLETNASFDAQTGLVDAVGKRIRELVPQHEEHWFEIYGRIAVTGEPERFTNEASKLDRWYDVYAFRTGEPEQRRVAVLFKDVTDARHAAEVVTRRAERDAFLVRLTDALRPLADPVEIQSETMRVLGRHLDVSRALYVEMEVDGKHFMIHRDYVDGVPSIVGRHQLDDFGASVAEGLRQGRTVATADIGNDPAVDDALRAAYEAIGVQACLTVPLVKDGRLVAVLALHQSDTRAWSHEERGLVEETADRTWAAVERARAEQQLRQSYDVFYNLVQSSPLGVYLVDGDFRLAQVSAGAQKVFENVHPLLGRDFEEVLHIVWPEPFASEAIAIFRHTLETGAPFHSADTTERRGDIESTESYDWQVERVALPDGRFGVVCYFYDFTDLRQAQEAVRMSEERFRSMADAAPTIVWTADPEGRITFRNRRWREFAGAENEGDWLSLVHPEDRNAMRGRWKHALASGENYEVEVRSQRRDGVYRWFLTRATAQRDERGQIVQWLGSSTDVHENKLLELRLREREVAERHARERAELLARIITELERAEGSRRRAERLVDLLVPQLAGAAAVSLAGDGEVVAARGQAGETVDLPLATGGESPGMLVVGPTDVSFSEDELGFLQKVAAAASLALANALLEEAQHQTAIRLQRALLPNALVVHPDIEIAARYEAGSDGLEVGGDWYDSFDLDERRVGLVVGDVVGQGLDAAASMGRMRTALQALATIGLAPAQLMEQLSAFAKGPDGVDFATVCYAVFDRVSGDLTYASTGHPPILLVNPDGTTSWLTEGQSVPLGTNVHAHREESTVRVEPGSLLILYSDGLVERRGELLSAGLERLERRAVALRGEPVEVVCATLVAELRLAEAVADDIVVMALRPSLVEAFHRLYPARSAELRRIRADVRRWLDDFGIPADAQTDIVLALGEACANAVEHPYADGDAGTVLVEIVPGNLMDELLLRVQDFGTWRDQSRSDGDRGRGTDIMRQVAHDFSRKSGPNGTTVSFRLRTAAGART